MARYILTRRVYNTLLGRGYKLACKICEVSFKVVKCPSCDSNNVAFKDSDEEYYLCKKCGHSGFACDLDGCIESKPSKYRKRKFYHCSCYEKSFIDLPNGDDDDEE